MHQAPEPTRLQRELREDTWIAPGLTAVPWTTGGRATSAPPAPRATPDCTCPTDCSRDHENE